MNYQAGNVRIMLEQETRYPGSVYPEAMKSAMHNLTAGLGGDVDAMERMPPDIKALYLLCLFVEKQP